MNIIYLNGEFLPREEAKISVMDRGFLFGDGVYEVIPVFHGHLFLAEAHLKRLQHSLNAIQIPYTISEQQWINIFNELLEKNQLGNTDLNIYLQITRGADDHRNHAFPHQIKPTIVAFCTPFTPMPRDVVANGFSAITLDDSRRRDCFIKAIALLPNILMYEEAKKAGAIEAILIRNGEIKEGITSNVFMVKDNQLFTPKADYQILNGVTRGLIINLAKENGIPCHETNISAAELNEADEIWVTGSSKEICPIIRLNGRPVGKGQVGPLWHRMINFYDNYKIHSREKLHSI